MLRCPVASTYCDGTGIGVDNVELSGGLTLNMTERAGLDSTASLWSGSGGVHLAFSLLNLIEDRQIRLRSPHRASQRLRAL